MKYNPEIMNLLLLWIGGIAAVQGLTEKLKCIWKNADSRLRKVLNYLASILVCFLVCATFLALNNSFSLKALFLYVIPVWLTASGIYDATHFPKTQ